MTIRVTDGDDETEHPVLVRQYRDAIGGVRVVRHVSAQLPRVNALLETYTYADRPLIASWVEPDGRIVDNAVIEMRVGALSFARMGVAGVRFTPRVPPDPDLFVDSDETGPLGVEITLDKDPDESSFQTEMQTYTAFLNSVAGDALPVHCNLGFKTVPRPRDADRIARAIIATVRENADVLGAHQFEGELASLFSQYLLSKRSDDPPFSAGGVVNDRGMPDHYASAMRRIAEKRDLKDYRTRGRQTWLLVGMSLPGLFAPDTNRQLYDDDLDLGQFDRIVLCHAFDYVVFERRLVTP